MIVVEDFDKEVLQRNGDYLLLFHAEWALPSLALLEDLSALTNIEVLVVDAETSPQESYQFGLQAIPTLIYMRDGEELRRKVGYDAEETISGVMEDV